MIDTKELRRLTQVALIGPDGVSLNWLKLLQDFQKEASPAAISELLDRLEAAESARRDDYQNWMTALDRNAELIAKLKAMEKERDALRTELAQLHKEADKFGDGIDWIQRALQAEAKIEELAHQEPVAWMSSRNGFIVKDNKNPDYNMPLYLAPGAKGE